MTKTIIAALITTFAAATVFAADVPAPAASGAAPVKAEKTTPAKKHVKAAPKKAAKAAASSSSSASSVPAKDAGAAPAPAPVVTGSTPAVKK